MRRTAIQMLRFTLVGFSGMFIALGVLNVVMLTVGSFLLAKALAFVCAVPWNFALNRRWTFQAGDQPWWRQLALYTSGCLTGAAVNWSVSCSLYYTLGFFNTHYNIAAVAGIVAAAGLRFLWAKHLVFRSHSPRKPRNTGTPEAPKALEALETAEAGEAPKVSKRKTVNNSQMQPIAKERLCAV